MRSSLKPEMSLNITLGVGIVLFLASLGLAFLPKGAPQDASRQKRKQYNTALQGATSAKLIAEKTRSENQRSLWSIDSEGIKARTLDTVSRLAKVHGLKMSSFRPQRLEETAALVRSPFMVLLEGSYPQVLSFLNSIENPASKLAVDSVQLTAVDAASDKVNATIGVIAFTRKSE